MVVFLAVIDQSPISSLKMQCSTLKINIIFIPKYVLNVFQMDNSVFEVNSKDAWSAPNIIQLAQKN